MSNGVLRCSARCINMPACDVYACSSNRQTAGVAALLRCHAKQSCLPCQTIWARATALALTVVLAVPQVVFAVSYYALPHEFTGIFGNDPERVVKNWHLFIAVAAGLWGGLLIGISTEYYTSNRYQPVKVRPVNHSMHVDGAKLS